MHQWGNWELSFLSTWLDSLCSILEHLKRAGLGQGFVATGSALTRSGIGGSVEFRNLSARAGTMISPFVLRMLRWRVRISESLRPGELQVTLFWAGMAGFLGALVSHLFRTLALGLHWVLTLRTEQLHWVFAYGEHRLEQVPPQLIQAAAQGVFSFGDLPVWERVLIPAWGGLAAGAILHFGTRLLKGASSTDYLEAISLGTGVLGVRSTLVKSLSSLVTIAACSTAIRSSTSTRSSRSSARVS